MTKLSLALSSGLIIATFLISSSVSFGKPEYSKKEKKGCVTCHVSAKSKDLNDTGKCYGEKKDLKTCAK
jgi:hypothetical protein